MHSYRPAHARRSFATLLALVLILPLTLTLSGCARAYTQSDVEDYVRNELGIEEFTIASEPVQKDPDHANYKYWEVTTDWYGLDRPITFDVIEYSAIDVTLAHKHSLHGDASDAIREAIVRMYHSDGKLTVFQVEDDDGELVNEWRYPVSCRADFEGSWSEIKKIQAFLKKYPRIGDVYFRIHYYVESADEAERYSDTFYDTYPISVETTTTHDDFLSQLYEHDGTEPVDLYLKDSLRFGVRSRIDEFSDAEIARVVKNENLTPVREYDDGKVFDPTIVYQVTNSAFPQIAYGNLFELARIVGLQVEGTWAEFEVRGADGQDYVFAYKNPAGDGWPAVTSVVAEQILGIPIDTLEKTVDRTISAETLAYVGMTPQELASYIEAHSQGLRVSTTIVDGGVEIYAKESVFDFVARSYEEEARELSEQITGSSSFFYYDKYQKVLELRLESEENVTGDNADRVTRIVKLMFLRHRLLDPSTTPFVVSVQKRGDAGYGQDFVEVATFNVPEDKLDFSNIWR